jgi:hypothetical protein
MNGKYPKKGQGKFKTIEEILPAKRRKFLPKIKPEISCNPFCTCQRCKTGCDEEKKKEF